MAKQLARVPLFGRRPRLAPKTTTKEAERRHIDPDLETLAAHHINLQKVMNIRDRILSSPTSAVSYDSLCRSSRLLRLHRGASHFIRRKFPNIFRLSHCPPRLNRTRCRLSPAAVLASSAESAAVAASAEARLRRFLSLSASSLRHVPLLRRELALPFPSDAEALAADFAFSSPAPVDTTFRQSFPPGMRVAAWRRARLEEWERLPPDCGEKQAVGLVREVLRLSVEKIVDVEKLRWLEKEVVGFKFDVMSLVLRHPGIFYLSTFDCLNTVFLREAYQGERLVCPDEVWIARRGLFDMVARGLRGDVAGELELGRECFSATDDDDDDDDYRY